VRKIKNEHFASLAIGAACISINIHASSYGYGGYDLGFLYGSQNLLWDNNVIRDVTFVLPLLFAGLLKLAAWINGNTFFAPFAASSTVYIIALLIGNFLYARASTRDATLRAVSLVLFTCTISINLLNPGNLWHSDLTSMIAITLLWTTYCAKTFRSSAEQAFSPILAALVLLCKQNLAPLYFASYLFYKIISWRAKRHSGGKVILRLAWILAVSGLITCGIAVYVGIDLRDYFETLRLIGAERGSPFANAENYLKFAPPELLSLGSLASSTRGLFNKCSPHRIAFSRTSLEFVWRYRANRDNIAPAEPEITSKLSSALINSFVKSLDAASASPRISLSSNMVAMEVNA
jgi:hypothetical protein